MTNLRIALKIINDIETGKLNSWPTLSDLSENWPLSKISVERCLEGEEGSFIEGMTDPEEEEAAECIEDIIDDLMESLQWDNEFDDD